MASPHPASLVPSGSVQILGQVNVSLSNSQKMVADKKNVTPTKETTKKSSSYSSTDEIKALDAKWLERFSRLEAPATARVSNHLLVNLLFSRFQY